MKLFFLILVLSFHSFAQDAPQEWIQSITGISVATEKNEVHLLKEDYAHLFEDYSDLDISKVTLTNFEFKYIGDLSCEETYPEFIIQKQMITKICYKIENGTLCEMVLPDFSLFHSPCL